MDEMDDDERSVVYLSNSMDSVKSGGGGMGGGGV